MPTSDDTDTPTPRWTLAALLRAPLSAADAEQLVEHLRAIAAADAGAAENAHEPAPDDEDEQQRYPSQRL